MSIGWIVVCFFTMFVALAMAEIVSAHPTSGGVRILPRVEQGMLLGVSLSFASMKPGALVCCSKIPKTHFFF